MQRYGLAVALAGILAAGAVGSAPAHAQDATRAVPSSRTEIQLSYAPLVHQISPAVVNVYASRVVSQNNGFPFEDPLFRRFFGNNLPFSGRKRIEESLGSGVIVGKTGLVVTNNHVIAGMTKVKVGLVDQRQFDAKVLISDANMDLAVLQIEGSHADFPTVPFAPGDGSQVGDLVLAIGNPYGLGQTVTSGIVSAIRRIDIGEGEDRVFIQTDAAINKGNSGGALVNMRGQLIGINSAILSPSGASAGIGFAIPSSLVRLVVAAAEAGKTSVVRPWLGATLQDVTPDLAQSLNLNRPHGALVAEVAAESPAAQAGLAPGDLVTAIDGHDVADPAELRYLFTTHPVGRTASLTVDRHGKNIVVPVKVEAPPDRPPRDQLTLTGSGPFAGATVENINPQVIEELGLSDDAGQGVVVASVQGGSTAEQIGFQKGDRVLALNDHSIGSTRELQQLNNTRSSYWRVTIDRGGRRITQVLQY